MFSQAFKITTGNYEGRRKPKTGVSFLNSSKSLLCIYSYSLKNKFCDNLYKIGPVIDFVLALNLLDDNNKLTDIFLNTYLGCGSLETDILIETQHHIFCYHYTFSIPCLGEKVKRINLFAQTMLMG